jgi:hypothetical protein
VPNQVASASIVANSLIQANAYGQLHAHVSMPVSASLTPNATGNYKGTTARVVAGPPRVLLGPTAHFQAASNIAGNSTFTTWVIFLLSGAFGGAGSITGSPVRMRLVSGVLAGAGTVELPPVASAQIFASSSLAAQAIVNRGVSASPHASSSFTSTLNAHRGAVSGIVASSFLSPPGRLDDAILAGSMFVASGETQRGVAASLVVAGASMAAHAVVSRNVHAAITSGSSFAASVHLTRGARAPMVAGASMAASATANRGVAAHIVGNSFLLDQFANASIVAGSSVLATAEVQHLIHNNPGVIQTIILGAQMRGSGTLQDKLLIALSGVLSGAGAISGTISQIYAAHPLPLVGSGGLHDSIPLPLNGFGTLSGFAELVQVPRPFCPPRHDKVFRFGYILTRGDLELRVCDAAGNTFAPVVVLYAFYQIVAGGQRMLVGPPNRRPATDTSGGKVGRYYATGTAGELGQPGEYVIVWRYQRSWWTPTMTFEEHFKVVDEVTSGDPGALNGRCCKYGWL